MDHDRINRLEAKNETLRNRLDAAIALLRELEYSDTFTARIGGDLYDLPECPCCLGLEGTEIAKGSFPKRVGHEPECRMARFLAEKGR